MSSLVTYLLLISACSCTVGGDNAGGPSSAAQEGDPCTPRSLEKCGVLKLVNETLTPLEEKAGKVG